MVLNKVATSSKAIRLTGRQADFKGNSLTLEERRSDTLCIVKTDSF